jgi:hypothetical protein
MLLRENTRKIITRSRAPPPLARPTPARVRALARPTPARVRALACA